MIWIAVILLFALIAAIAMFIFKTKSLAGQYVREIQNDDLAEVGVSPDQFIGLHIKNLPLTGLQTKLIHVRKTTPYIGLIVFAPDRQEDYRFYLPFIYKLCRLGYLIVTYKNHDMLKGYDELQAVIAMINEDQVLSTYPRVYLGHGSGAYAILNVEEKTGIIAINPPVSPAQDLSNFLQDKYPVQWVKKPALMICRHFIPDAFRPLKISEQATVYCLVGEDEKAKNTGIESVLVPGGHWPFLTTASEHALIELENKLKDPKTFQFEYEHLKETFPPQVLYALNPAFMTLLEDHLGSLVTTFPDPSS